jgi:hypothetical protein
VPSGRRTAAELIINHGTWLRRDDFTRQFIHTQAGPGDSITAAIDWEQAVTALQAGNLTCSSSEGAILHLAASLATEAAVSLRHAITRTRPRQPPLAHQCSHADRRCEGIWAPRGAVGAVVGQSVKVPREHHPGGDFMQLTSACPADLAKQADRFVPCDLVLRHEDAGRLAFDAAADHLDRQLGGSVLGASRRLSQAFPLHDGQGQVDQQPGDDRVLFGRVALGP